MSKFKNIWSGLIKRKKYIMFIIAFSFICTLAFSEYVGSKVFQHARYMTIKCEAYSYDTQNGSNFKIVDNYYSDEKTAHQVNCKYGFYNFEQLKKSMISNKGYTIVEAKDSKLSCGYFQPQYQGASIEFSVPIYPNTCITLLTEGSEYRINIFNEYGNTLRQVNGEEVGAVCIRDYLFGIKDCAYLYKTYIAYYLAVFFVLAFSISTILIIMIGLREILPLCDIRVQGISFAIIAVFQFVYTSISYYYNQMLFYARESSDAYYYMNPIFKNDEDKLSIATYLYNTYSFRGYIPHLVSAVNKSIAYRIGIQAIYFDYALFAIIFASTFAFAFPALYKNIYNKKANCLTIFTSYALFYCVWRNFFFYYLSDIPAAMFAIDAIVAFFYAMKTDKKKYYLLSGILIGLAGGYRSAYSYIAYVMLVIITCFIWKKVKNKSRLYQPIIFLMIFCVGIFVVLWPQGVLNYMRSAHIGLFPYDSGWMNDINTGKAQNLAEYSFSDGLHSYYYMAEERLDKQMSVVDTSLYYERTSNYFMNDAVFMVCDNPLAYISSYMKKLFYAMSAGYEYAYARFSLASHWCIILQLLNYFMIGNVLYCLIKGKKELGNNKVRVLYIVLALVTVGLQTLLHIERRYYIIYFLMIYFFNGCVLINHRDEEDIFDYRYLVSILGFVAICYMLRQTIECNFLF